jgi:ketol-acid reductoisomerase
LVAGAVLVVGIIDEAAAAVDTVVAAVPEALQQEILKGAVAVLLTTAPIN